VVSTICDERGEEPTYAGVTMTSLMTGDFCVGDVISLLWFKRQLPQYATRFIEMCVMLCADHGPCVSGSLSPLCWPPVRPDQQLTRSAPGGMLSHGECCRTIRVYLQRARGLLFDVRNKRHPSTRTLLC